MTDEQEQQPDEQEEIAPLTKAQKVFVDEYLICFNGTAAYLKAYPKTKSRESALASVLTDPVLAKARYTVSGLKSIAGRAVVSVRMDKWTGRLKPSGVLHWVVVTDVIPERTGYGGVEVYNPFPNRIEAYSWSEFLASAGVPYGVVMSKESGL